MAVDRINSMQFSPDGKHLALLSMSVISYVVRLEDGQYYEIVTADLPAIEKARSGPFAPIPAPNRISRYNTVEGTVAIKTRRGNAAGVRQRFPLLLGADDMTFVSERQTVNTLEPRLDQLGNIEQLFPARLDSSPVPNGKPLTLPGVGIKGYSPLAASSLQLLFQNGRSADRNDFFCVNRQTLKIDRIRLPSDMSIQKAYIAQEIPRVCLFRKEGLLVAEAQRVDGQPVVRAFRTGEKWPSPIYAASFVNGDRWVAIGGLNPDSKSDKKAPDGLILFLDAATGEIVHRELTDSVPRNLKASRDGIDLAIFTQGGKAKHVLPCWLRIDGDQVRSLLGANQLRQRSGLFPAKEFSNSENWELAPDGRVLAYKSSNAIYLVDVHDALEIDVAPFASGHGTSARIEMPPQKKTGISPERPTKPTSRLRADLADSETPRQADFALTDRGGRYIVVETLSSSSPRDDSGRCEFSPDGNWLVWFRGRTDESHLMLFRIRPDGRLTKVELPDNRQNIAAHADGFRFSAENQLLVISRKQGTGLWTVTENAVDLVKSWPSHSNQRVNDALPVGQFLSERWFVCHDGSNYNLFDLRSAQHGIVDSFRDTNSRYLCTPDVELLIFDSSLDHFRRFRVENGLFQDLGTVPIDTTSRGEHELDRALRLDSFSPTTAVHSWVATGLRTAREIRLGKNTGNRSGLNLYLWSWNGKAFAAPQILSLSTGSDAISKLRSTPRGEHLFTVAKESSGPKTLLIVFDRQLKKVGSATIDVVVTDFDAVGIHPRGQLLAVPHKRVVGTAPTACELNICQLESHAGTGTVAQARDLAVQGEWIGGGYTYWLESGLTGRVEGQYGHTSVGYPQFKLSGMMENGRFIGTYYYSPTSTGDIEIDFESESRGMLRWRTRASRTKDWNDSYWIERVESRRN